jgi:hypothetical protein
MVEKILRRNIHPGLLQKTSRFEIILKLFPASKINSLQQGFKEQYKKTIYLCTQSAQKRLFYISKLSYYGYY